MPLPPPLGNLRGMYYDPEKERYFPLSMRGADGGLAQSVGTGGGLGRGLVGVKDGLKCAQSREGKRRRAEGWDVNLAPEARRRAGRMRRRGDGERIHERVANAVDIDMYPHRRHEITSVQAYATGVSCTLESGDVVLYAEGPHMRTNVIEVCSQNVLGLHNNILRQSMMIVSNGHEPHAHYWRTSSECYGVHDPMIIDIPQRDVWAMSSFDTVTSLAAAKSLTTIRAGERLTMSYRRLKSDALVVHQTSYSMVLAGLRNSHILLEDLRTASSNQNIMAKLPQGKAVVGVKRLKDSAVPWGVLASGLDNQLMIFDMRFASSPLRTFEGHQNSFHTGLALVTDPEDVVVFAASADQRIRAWSTVTGEQIKAPCKNSKYLLNTRFTGLTKSMDVGGDMSIRIASGSSLFRYEAENGIGRELEWEDLASATPGEYAGTRMLGSAHSRDHARPRRGLTPWSTQ